MNMFSAGGGLGMGVKKFSAVFVFHNRETFDQFVQFVEKGRNFTDQAALSGVMSAVYERQYSILSVECLEVG